VSRAAALLLGLAALAGCGHTTSVPLGGAVTVLEFEYHLTPGSVHARAGSLTFLARNFGRLTHDLVINSGPGALVGTKPIPPGSSARLTVDLPPGHYTLVSNMFDDQNLGLYGSLEVTR
jgi:hypothetical protein